MRFSIFFFVLVVFMGCGEESNSRNQLSKNWKHILFVGNSYTYRNKGVDRHLADLAKASGDSTYFVTRAAKGKYHLKTHFNDKDSKDIFRQHKWEKMVLQEYSNGSLREYSSFKKYAQRWAHLARQKNPKVKLYLYATWGYKNAVGMFDSVYVRYDRVAKQIGAKVVPVGLAWRTVQPKLNLYDGDGAHPNRKGTFLAACMFYEYVLHKNVTKTPDTDEYLSKSIQRSIKKWVHEYAENERDRFRASRRLTAQL